MSEHTYYTDAGVQVTNARFICGDRTLAMSGVTAVSAQRHALTKPQQLLLTCGVLLFLLADPAFLRVSGALMTAYAAWFLLRPPYSVVVTSASGHHTLITDRQRARVTAIVQAINEALVHRA
ncbi:DUF6232 family protein [Deinococcus sp. A31D244]|uniref:DUF6232 family protein n=1 Tax=Deinococcus aquaticus TaxID=328692 RepID=A0ABY7V6N3_9DEIO|nr:MULTISPECIES: DUF6232 family protein [Deinococcus]PIG97165.1 hypothetical protein AMD26_014205 [Deinococcus sp. UR1]WDA60790.1 DUF6232 family protein [Deinococcus aquaticus]GHG32999.1 hypothetical protein GCM10017784_28350 [Deinococcus indicus]